MHKGCELNLPACFSFLPISLGVRLTIIIITISIASSSSFDILIINDHLQRLDCNFTEPLDDGTHYWRIRARDDAGNWGVWSSIWSFTISTQVITSASTNEAITPTTTTSTTTQQRGSFSALMFVLLCLGKIVVCTKTKKELTK